MKVLPPVASAEIASAGAATAAWHGGNDYRGPGAWTRSQGKSKKRPRTTLAAAADGPLDLAAVLGESWRLDLSGKPCHRDKARLKVANRSKRGKAATLQARLEALSLQLVPSHEEVAADPLATKSRTPRRASFKPSAAAGSRSPCGTLLPLGPDCHVGRQSDSRGQPGGGAIDAFVEEPECAVPGDEDSSSTKKIMPNDPQRGLTIPRQDSTPLAPPVPTQINQSGPRQPQEPEVTSRGLRIPNAATKMSVDDRCNAELLGARATLRLLLREQRRLGEAMRQRRIAACLVKGSEAGHIRRGKSTAPLGRRERRRHGGRGRLGEAPGLRRRLSPNAHPLLFMAEADLQKVELEQMRLEDAEAKYTSM